jgi:hypothetical protein
MDKLEAFGATFMKMVQRFKEIDALATASTNTALIHHWKWWFHNCQVRVILVFRS